MAEGELDSYDPTVVGIAHGDILRVLLSALVHHGAMSDGDMQKLLKGAAALRLQDEGAESDLNREVAAYIEILREQLT